MSIFDSLLLLASNNTGVEAFKIILKKIELTEGMYDKLIKKSLRGYNDYGSDPFVTEHIDYCYYYTKVVEQPVPLYINILYDDLFYNKRKTLIVYEILKKNKIHEKGLVNKICNYIHKNVDIAKKIPLDEETIYECPKLVLKYHYLDEIKINEINQSRSVLDYILFYDYGYSFDEYLKINKNRIVDGNLILYKICCMDAINCFCGFIDNNKIIDEELNWRSDYGKNLIESLIEEKNVKSHYVVDLVWYGFKSDPDLLQFAGIGSLGVFDNVCSRDAFHHLKNMIKLNKEFYDKK